MMDARDAAAASDGDPAARRGEPVPAALLERAREALRADAVAGRGGADALGRFSEAIDGLVRLLVAWAPVPEQPVAVFAVGGYGRRQLCLHSDIDLLLLFGGAPGAAEERFVRGVLHPLWDVKLAVGHHVRALADFDALEVDNPEFLLAVFDHRLLIGDQRLVKPFTKAFHAAGTHEYLTDALLALTDERHQRFNDTPYQLEPDVKDAPGGLRDVTATRTLWRLAALRGAAPAPADTSAIDAAEEFLLKLRSMLHLDGRRNANVLRHELQHRGATTLGYAGPPQQRVEQLMSDYFRHARAVGRALAAARGVARRPSPRPSVSLGPDLEWSQQGVTFRDPQQAAASPASWLTLFDAAIDARAPVAESALVLIERHGADLPPEAFVPEGAGPRFLEVLRPRPGVHAGLQQMHECGLLGRILPEFAAVTSRVIRDFHHTYTVDEHTLLTIRTVERLSGSSPDNRSLERFTALLEAVDRPALLVLALLLHDVGKWKDGEHAAESTRMASQALARLGLEAGERAIVEFLVRHHLEMSLVAFRRDTDDPDVVKRFAAVVGVEQRLMLLTLMTLADVSAVNPEALTDWKQELLWRLYVETYNELTRAYGDTLIDPSQPGLADLLSGRPADLAEDEILAFLEGLPQRYLRSFRPEAIYRHVRLSRDIQPDEVHGSLEHTGAAWELAVVTLDKPFLFSNIAGVLASFGMDILRGCAMTSPSGLVLDVFQFTDRERYFAMNPGAEERVREVLADVVGGRTAVTDLLRGRLRGAATRRTAPRTSPVVHVDNHSSRRYTIVEAVADDSAGLLYRISRLISNHRCAIELVLISTEGQRAVDVFHVTSNGSKLSDQAQRELSADLYRMLEENHEVD